jgi:hypothetical protein
MKTSKVFFQKIKKKVFYGDIRRLVKQKVRSKRRTFCFVFKNLIKNYIIFAKKTKLRFLFAGSFVVLEIRLNISHHLSNFASINKYKYNKNGGF